MERSEVAAPRRIRTNLLEIVSAISATTRDDAEVVAIALHLLRRGRARRLRSGAPALRAVS